MNAELCERLSERLKDVTCSRKKKKTNVKGFARCASWRDSVTKGQSTHRAQQPEWQSQVSECQLEGESLHA